jgi:hypothetical protein
LTNSVGRFGVLSGAVRIVLENGIPEWDSRMATHSEIVDSSGSGGGAVVVPVVLEITEDEEWNMEVDIRQVTVLGKPEIHEKRQLLMMENH